MSNIILTPFSNSDKRERMLEFMLRNSRSPNLLTDSHDYEDGIMIPQKGEDRGFARNPPSLGFPYNAGTSDFERGYGWALCAWMAIQDGSKTRKQGKLRPYLLYNGDDRLVLLTNGRDGDQNEDSISTDENGFSSLYVGRRVVDPKRGLLKANDVVLLNGLVKKELARLSEVYQRLK